MLKVYITDLSAYNQGFLEGKWVDLSISEEELSNEIKEVLENGAKVCKETNHEEYFITDYEFETEYKLFKVEEYSNVYELRNRVEELEMLSDEDLKRVSYLIDHLSYKFEEALEKYEDVTIYENMTLKDVVEQYIDETVDFSNIPKIIANNIDYDSIARDWEISGEFDSIDGDVYHYVN